MADADVFPEFKGVVRQLYAEDAGWAEVLPGVIDADILSANGSTMSSPNASLPYGPRSTRRTYSLRNGPSCTRFRRTGNRRS